MKNVLFIFLSTNMKNKLYVLIVVSAFASWALMSMPEEAQTSLERISAQVQVLVDNPGGQDYARLVRVKARKVINDSLAILKKYKNSAQQVTEVGNTVRRLAVAVGKNQDVTGLYEQIKTQLAAIQSST